MLSPLRGRVQDDRGLVLPVAAIVMVLMLVMVAFAVDLGAAAVSRREAQNGADSAALAAAQELGRRSAKFTSGATRITALAAAEQAAKSYVSENTGLSTTAPEWASCTDALALAVAASTPCISFSSDATQVRVRLPDKVLNHQFAKVVGLNSSPVRASAVAEVVTVLGGYTRPILLRAGQMGYKCIEGGGTQTCPSNPPALGSGDFGTLTSPRYNLVTSGGDAANFALGVDHMLQLAPTNGVNYCDSKNSGDANKCSSQASGLLNNTSATHDFANYLVVDSGGQLGDVTDGLIGSKQSESLCPSSVECFEDGGETITALLYRPDGADSSALRPIGSPAAPTVDLFGRDDFNGVHVSRYLLPAMRATVGCGAAPNAVTVSVVDSGYDSSGCNAGLSSYISAGATGVPLFSKDITQSPRFGVAPVTDTAVGGSSTLAKITDFYGIYIDRLYGNNNQVKGMTAFVFPLAMIEPNSSVGTGPGLPYVGGPFGVRLIR